MRALLWAVLAIAGIWAGYWWVGSTAMQRGVENWFTDQAARGLIATRESVQVHGFPNRFDLTVNGVTLQDPASGYGWSAPFAQVFMMTWKPWHLIAALPHSQSLMLPGQTATLQSDKMMGSLLLHPGPSLALNGINLEVIAPKLSSTQGWAMQATTLFASTLQDETRVNSHRLGLSLAGLQPDAGWMRALADSDLPATVEDIHFDGYAGFTAPIDRHMGDSRPRITALQVKEARVFWGPLQITAEGQLAADAEGRASGEIAFRIRGWRHLPPVVVALGLIKPQLAPTLERGFEVLTQNGADPELLEISLKCADGRMSLGPLPLGQAPLMN